MEKEQALQLIKQVVESYRGTLQEHQTLQTAFKTISDALIVENDTKLKEADAKRNEEPTKKSG